MWVYSQNIKYIVIFIRIKSTAVEQAIACALVTQRARVQSPVGASFLGEVFSGFFLTSKMNVRKPTRSLNIIWPSLSSLIISLRAPMTWDVDVPYNSNIQIIRIKTFFLMIVYTHLNLSRYSYLCCLDDVQLFCLLLLIFYLQYPCSIQLASGIII